MDELEWAILNLIDQNDLKLLSFSLICVRFAFNGTRPRRLGLVYRVVLAGRDVWPTGS